jgi:hypothetical protein
MVENDLEDLRRNYWTRQKQVYWGPTRAMTDDEDKYLTAVIAKNRTAKRQVAKFDCTKFLCDWCSAVRWRTISVSKEAAVYTSE